MPRPKLSPGAYEQLKRFVAYFSNTFLNAASLPQDQTPLAVLAALEKSSQSKAERGLLMAIDDCVALTESWKPDKQASVDEELKRLGLISLSELRHRYSRKYLRLLKQAKIRSEDEYYFVKGILDDKVLEPGASEYETLVSMMTVYEASVLSKQSK